MAIKIINPIISEAVGGGGASFNIHYGLNPPEDTSMLWVETEKEVAKTTITADFSMEEILSQLDYTLPSNLYGGGQCPVIGNKAYIISGNWNNSTSNSIVAYDTENGKFETLAVTLPKILSQNSAVAVGNKIYIFGGYSSWSSDGSNDSNDIYVFDVENNTLEKLEPTLSGKSKNMGIALVGTKIYLFGGNASGSSSGSGYIRVFDTADNSLVTLTSTLPRSVFGSYCVAVGTSIYIFGGWMTGETTASNAIFKFDTETELISVLSTTIPSTLGGHSGGRIGNNIYIFGGRTTTLSTAKNTIYVFDIAKETIAPSSITLPKVMIEALSATIGGAIYLLGGRSYSGSSVLLQTILAFVCASELVEDNCVIVPSLGGTKIELMSGDNTLQLGVSFIAIGNENNQGEFAEAYLYNETSQAWELI